MYIGLPIQGYRVPIAHLFFLPSTLPPLTLSLILLLIPIFSICMGLAPNIPEFLFYSICFASV